MKVKAVTTESTETPTPAPRKHSRRPKFVVPEDCVLAVAARKAGGRAELAKALGVTSNTLRGIERWVVGGKPMPAKYVLGLCEVTRMKPHALRPDLYQAHWTLKRPAKEG